MKSISFKIKKKREGRTFCTGKEMCLGAEKIRRNALAVKHAFGALFRRKRIGAASLLLLLASGVIFSMAELGGYGVNGPASAPNSLNYGLVGYWDMEEGGGQTVKDKSGNGNDGTLGASSAAGSDDPVFAPGFDASGPNGTGLQFDGVNDYLDCGDANELDFGTGSFSVSWRAKYPQTQADNYSSVFSKGFRSGAGFANSFGMAHNGYATNALKYYEIQTAGSFATAVLLEQNIADGWHSFVFIRDTEEGKLRLYDNGVLTADVAYSADVNVTNAYNLYLGRNHDGNSTVGTTLDEVRFYNRVLSADESRLLYNQKKPILEMKFDEGSGTVAHDESFNHYDGTLGGDALGTDLPAWVEGKDGGALHFDGTDDYLSRALALDADNGTVSAWVKDPAMAAGEYVLRSDANIRTYFDITNESFLFVKGNPFTQVGDSIPLAGVAGWHHYELTWHNVGGSLYSSSYFDGVKIGSEVSFADSTDGTYVTLGGFLATGTENASCTIDNLRVYNYARTDDEVLADYNDNMAAHLGENNQDLNRGLVGYWDMEEGSGQAVEDKSGNGNDGALGSSSSADSADPVFAPGHDSNGANGLGVSFDGIDDYVHVDDSDSLDITSAFSVGVWIKPISSQSDNEIISRYGGGPTQGFGLYYGYGSYYLYLATENTAWEGSYTNENTLALDSWQHIFVTYDNVNTAKFYIDGVLVKTDTTTWSGKILNYADGGAFIGLPGWGGEPDRKIIDEVRLYNRAVSDDEVLFLYNRKKPILQMKFDEGSGAVAYDESFNHNDGSLGGGTAGYMPTRTTGKNGGGLEFDGTDDYVSVSDNDSSDVKGRITIEAWIYPDALPEEDLIVSNGGDSSCGNYDFYIYNGNLALLSFGACSWSYAGANAQVAIGSWQHVAATYDGTNVNYYIDGVLKDSKAWGTLGEVYEGNLEIGKQQAYSAGYFDGKMDNVVVYNYARSAGEILADYNAGQAAHLGKNNQDLDAGLAGYWDMEEGSGQTIYDKSENGNDGSLGVSSAAGSDDPVFAPGHDSGGAQGTALAFDGVNDYMELNHPSSLNIRNELTLSAWVKPSVVGSGKGIIFRGTSTQAPQYLLFMDNNRFYMYNAASSSVYNNINSGFTLTAGKWYHVVGVVSVSAQKQKIYVNGVLKNSFDWTYGSLRSDTSKTRIGSRDGASFFPGAIDEVRIYNRALSDDEIRFLYNQKKPILEYKFDEGSGAAAYDDSFNDNDAALVNAPAYVAGKSATALDLESTGSQYGYLADNAGISLTKDLALSVWIKPESVTASTLFDIAGKWDGANESYLLAQYGDEIRLYIDSASNYKTTDSANLAAGNWYHVEAVYAAASQNVDIYINGILQAGTVTGTIPASIGDDAGRFQIGAEDSTAAAANFYDGVIDSLRLYSYARTAGEAGVDYNNGLAAHLR